MKLEYEKRFAEEIMGLALRFRGCTLRSDRPAVAARFLLDSILRSMFPEGEPVWQLSDVQAKELSAGHPGERIEHTVFRINADGTRTKIEGGVDVGQEGSD